MGGGEGGFIFSQFSVSTLAPWLCQRLIEFHSSNYIAIIRIQRTEADVITSLFVFFCGGLVCELISHGLCYDHSRIRHVMHISLFAFKIFDVWPLACEKKLLCSCWCIKI